MEEKTLYTVPEAAKYLGICNKAVYEEVHAGRLNALVRRGYKKGWRIRKEELDNWLKNGMTNAV